MNNYFPEFGENPTLDKRQEDNAELTLTDISWLAGIIDGEGSISMFRDKKGKNTVMVNITNSDLLLLNKCKKIVSIILNKEIKIYTKNCYVYQVVKPKKQVYTIEIRHFKNLSSLLRLLLPYLTSKKQKAEMAIVYLDVRMKEIEKYGMNKKASLETNRLFDNCRRGVTTEREAPFWVKPQSDLHSNMQSVAEMITPH